MWESLLSFWTEQSMVQTLMVICIVSALGLYLAKLKVSKFTLGSTYVFFVGILFAHFGVKVNGQMLLFCQNFGLIVFVYVLGLQVGPGFVASLRRQGVRLNVWGMGIVFLGTALMLLIYALSGQQMGDLLGVLSGAVTNTPALAAAQQTLSMVAGEGTAPAKLESMALATAITYPLGVVGVIVVLTLLRPLAKRKTEGTEWEEMPPHAAECEVANPAIIGKRLSEVHESFGVDFVVSRLWRKGRVVPPTSDMLLHEGDHVIVVCKEEDLETVTALMGRMVDRESFVDWQEDDPNHLVSRRLLITKTGFNGVKLGSLRLRNTYGVNVTRVSRAEIDLLPTPSLRLQLGDRLTVVGSEGSISKLAERIGNKLDTLDMPYLVSIFLGIFLGCALGSIPIALPGLSQSIRLGIAGGPILVGILMGAYGSRLHMTTYITQSANLMLRTFGLVIYLACLGIASGASFFSTLIHGDGLLWMLLGALITTLPTLLMGYLAITKGRIPYGIAGGVMCGMMSNPMALEYLLSNGGDNRSSVSYATVYPLGMFLRIVLAQVLCLMFVH